MTQSTGVGWAGYWDGSEIIQEVKRRQRRNLVKSIKGSIEPSSYRHLLSKETREKLEKNESSS